MKRQQDELQERLLHTDKSDILGRPRLGFPEGRNLVLKSFRQTSEADSRHFFMDLDQLRKECIGRQPSSKLPPVNANLDLY
jgi:hypothetical protein